MYVCLCVCGRAHAAPCQERCKSCVGLNVKILSCVSSANECFSSRRVWIFNCVSAFVWCVWCVWGSAKAERALRFSLCLIEFSHRGTKRVIAWQQKRTGSHTARLLPIRPKLSIHNPPHYHSKASISATHTHAHTVGPQGTIHISNTLLLGTHFLSQRCNLISR